MDNFMRKCNLSKLTSTDIEGLDNPIFIEETKLLWYFPTQKAPGSNSFTREFYQTLKVQIVPMPHKLFQNLKN